MKQNNRDVLLTIEEELTRMAEDVPEMPSGFHAGWVRAVEEEKAKQGGAGRPEKKPGVTQWRRLLYAAAAVVILIGGVVLIGRQGQKDPHASPRVQTEAFIPANREQPEATATASAKQAQPMATAALAAQKQPMATAEAAAEAVYEEAEEAAEAAPMMLAASGQAVSGHEAEAAAEDQGEERRMELRASSGERKENGGNAAAPAESGALYDSAAASAEGEASPDSAAEAEEPAEMRFLAASDTAREEYSGFGVPDFSGGVLIAMNIVNRTGSGMTEAEPLP